MAVEVAQPEQVMGAVVVCGRGEPPGGPCGGVNRGVMIAVDIEVEQVDLVWAGRDGNCRDVRVRESDGSPCVSRY